MKKEFRVELSAEELMVIYAACFKYSFEDLPKVLAARLEEVLGNLDEVIFYALTIACFREEAAQSEAVKEERKKFTNTFVNLFRP